MDFEKINEAYKQKIQQDTEEKKRKEINFFTESSKKWAEFQKAYADYMSEQMKDKRNYHLLSDILAWQ